MLLWVDNLVVGNTEEISKFYFQTMKISHRFFLVHFDIRVRTGVI